MCKGCYVGPHQAQTGEGNPALVQRVMVFYPGVGQLYKRMFLSR